MSVRAAEILSGERVAAWSDYLDSTRNQIDVRYEEMEPWAWSRLQAKLKAIDTRATVLGEKARGDHEEDDGA